MRARGHQGDRKRWAVVAMGLGVAGFALLGCTSEADDAEPAATTVAASPSAASGSDGADGSGTEDGASLDLGALSVKTSPSGVSASAEDAERCGSSQWRLTGPVTYEQASPVPDQCFGGAHAFDTTWYGLSLPPGEYELSLTIQRGVASGTTTAAFEITGASA